MSSTNNKTARRRKYALITLISVLCIVVIALTITLVVSAANGRSMAQKYNGLNGPPPDVDLSQYTGGEDGGQDVDGGLPPGVYAADESNNDAQGGVPLDVDAEGSSEGPVPENVTIPEEVLGGSDNLGLEGGYEEGLNDESPEYDDGSPEYNEYDSPYATSSNSASASPTMSPITPTPPSTDDEDTSEDTMDEWSGLVEEGGCFDGWEEIACCLLFMC